VFYSVFEDGDAFYRFRYDARLLGRARIRFADPYWRVTEDMGVVCMGEDPRVLVWRGRKVVIDNFYDDVHLIYPDSNYERVRVPIPGKNLTFFADDEHLYCARWLRPLELWRTSDGVVWHLEHRDASGESDTSLRGGTPGYASEEGWWGLGHRTTATGSGPSDIRHEPFRWTIRKSPWRVEVGAALPTQSAITDPTCVVRGELVTAESRAPWFTDQDYACVVSNIF
jgi:hypothetical protein